MFAVCGRGAVILGSSYACSLIYSIKQYQISTIGSKTAVTNTITLEQIDYTITTTGHCMKRTVWLCNVIAQFFCIFKFCKYNVVLHL